VLVRGTVTNERGERVPGVRVAVRGAGAEPIVSDPSGGYALRLVPEGAATLRFSAAGYADEIVALEPATLAGEQVELDVRLEDAPGATVSGTLATERGVPLAGETIQLRATASQATHSVLTGTDGRFSIPGVTPGPGYYLSVRPAAGYGDYQRALEVGPDGAFVPITLRELSTTRLSGRLVDVEGDPIAGLELTVVSGQALGRTLATATDDEGRFELADVPTGHLSFAAKPPESLVLGGVLVSPGSDAELLLRADWGEHALRGRVLGADGRPLGGAEVELSWSHAGEGSRGRSVRSAVTDASGAFEFGRLGAGIHRIDVRAAGHRELAVDYEVSARSPGLELALEPAESG
jgi:hypothetical protein